jgi:hypothetical protein
VGLARRAAPYRPGLTADHQSVGSIPPYARQPRRPYYDSISGVTGMSPGKASPIKAGPIERTQAAVSPTVRCWPPLEPPRNICSARRRRCASHLIPSLANTRHPWPMHRSTRAAQSSERVL